MTERVFSMSAGLDTSTVTPGRTAPEASLTVPTIDACACAIVGMTTSDSTNRIALTHLTMLSLHGCDIGRSYSKTERPFGHYIRRLTRCNDESGRTLQLVGAISVPLEKMSSFLQFVHKDS